MMNYIKARLASFKYALEGILEVLDSQANPKIHGLAAILVIMAGVFFDINATEWCLLVLCITSVLGAETLNTAIEHLTDLVSPDFHPLAKKTKDAAAGGVLWVALGALLVGMIIFAPKIINLL